MQTWCFTFDLFSQQQDAKNRQLLGGVHQRGQLQFNMKQSKQNNIPIYQLDVVNKAQLESEKGSKTILVGHLTFDMDNSSGSLPAQSLPSDTQP